MTSPDGVMMTSSEEAMANEGDKSRVGEGSRGNRGEGVGKSSSTEGVEEMGVGDDSTTAEGLDGRRAVELESVGMTESLPETMDDVMAG